MESATAIGRKSWQFASTITGEKLSQIHNPGNNSLLIEHAYNTIHRRYQYDPAGELTRTLDKLRGEIKYEYEANGQLHSRDTGRLVNSEEFRYDAAANRLNFNTSQFDQVKDNRIKQWRDQEYAYDAWGNLIEKRSGLNKLQTFTHDCENRLVRGETMVNSQVHSVGTCRYDSLGRRIGKTPEIEARTEHKHFLWQGLRMLREETPWQCSLYIYEPGSYAPLARVDQAEGEAEQKLYYFHTDQIGTPLEMTNVDGQIVWNTDALILIVKVAEDVARDLISVEEGLRARDTFYVDVVEDLGYEPDEYPAMFLDRAAANTVATATATFTFDESDLRGDLDLDAEAFEPSFLVASAFAGGLTEDGDPDRR